MNRYAFRATMLLFSLIGIGWSFEDVYSQSRHSNVNERVSSRETTPSPDKRARQSDETYRSVLESSDKSGQDQEFQIDKEANQQLEHLLKMPQERLVVKFRDDLGARAERGDVRFLADDLAAKQHQVWLGRLSDMGVRFEQLIQLSDDKLWYLETRATALSGNSQPDLASMMLVHAPDDLLPLIAIELWAWELVHWVEFEMVAPPPPTFDEPCMDIPPTTPNYTNLQGYRGPNPGLNMNAIWQLGNAKGEGVRIADCEYGYNADHEDLCGIIPEPNQTMHPNVIANNWHEHGTAVMGEMVGGENSYGVTGLVPDAQAYFFFEWTVQGGSRRVTCIANAIAAMDPGDVVLLEMQTSILGGQLYGPAELNQSVWTVVKNGVDAGVIVVGAAGNGNQNLDGPDYQSYRNRGDSGAIIVGAGSANTAHNKLSFSTYGSRVNVQGWGQSVFTAGYGGYSQIGGDFNQRYTSTFSGTSSASPFVASACVALQSYAIANLGRRLTPAEMRDALLNTGHPQGSGGNIGNFPDMIMAAQYIMDQWGPLTITPESFTITGGLLQQGSLADLAHVDGQRIHIEASKWQPPIGRLPDPGLPADSHMAQIEISGTVPLEDPTSLSIVLVAYCDVKGINQTIELFNFDSQSFEKVDARSAGVNSDQVTHLVIANPPIHYFQENTGLIRARATFAEGSRVSAISWHAYIDQFVWLVQD